MRAALIFPVLLCAGCGHGSGGSIEAASIGAGAAIFGDLNQDALSFLKINPPVTTLASGATGAGAK